MKDVIYLFSIILLVSCGSPEQQSKLANRNTMSFSVDTVMVDPGQEIVFLNRGIHQSFLSSDRGYLYNFNPSDNSLEKIDLNELRLEKKIPFEKEGPNGIGENVHTILPLNVDSLYFGSYSGVGGIFTWEGKKVMDLPLNKLGDKTEHLSSNEQLGGIKSFSTGAMVFYGLISVFDKDETELATIDVNAQKISRISLPLMDRTRPFRVTFRDGPAKSSISPGSYLVTEGNKVILSTGVSNEMYVLDKGGDSLQHFSYDSQIMPIEKAGKYHNEVNSEEEMYAIYQTINEEINYNAPFWDPEEELFYRFSYIGEYHPNSDKPVFDVIPDRCKVFLTIYDENLELIGESLVPELTKVPGRHFAKNGKIWIFENMEDEMGFVRLSIDF